MSLKKIPALVSAQKAFGSIFAALPFSANQITVFSVVLAAIGFWFSLSQQVYPSLFFFLLSAAADALDGAVARAKKQVSAYGAYIDGITDRLVEFLFILALLAYPLPLFILSAPLLLILILFFGSAMTSFATAYAEHRHVADAKKIAAQPGILPRAERILALALAMFLIPFNPALASGVLFATAALCMVTFAQRFAYFAKG
ncbi:MAG: CDP-alcohol phosphatidyltransferase family protein [Candidatus Micrarchaeia archaeon]